MSTYDFSLTASDVIREALFTCGALGENESPSGQTTTDALRRLNVMIKSWQTQGFHMWARKQTTLFLVPSQTSYSLGPESTDDHWAETFYYTALNGAHSSGATSLTVDSSSDMTAGDKIGIELTAGTRQWTTIKTVSSSTVVTLNDALTGAASDDGTVYTYTSRPQRPLKVRMVTRGPYTGASDIDP